MNSMVVFLSCLQITTPNIKLSFWDLSFKPTETESDPWAPLAEGEGDHRTFGTLFSLLGLLPGGLLQLQSLAIHLHLSHTISFCGNSLPPSTNVSVHFPAVFVRKTGLTNDNRRHTQH